MYSSLEASKDNAMKAEKEVAGLTLRLGEEPTTMHLREYGMWSAGGAR